jgi:hypothetical protein
LEDKILGILSKTLPNLLSGLLQEAIGQARVQPSHQAIQRATSVEVAIVSAAPELPLGRVDIATQEVGVQGMDVDQVDEATHMDASTLAVDAVDTADANVSSHSPCLSTFFDSVHVTESPPGCLIQVGARAPL